jgi:hypothetical protein
MKSTVATYSAESRAQVDRAAKARALMAGTDGMRAAGKVYLPKFPAESEEAYEARLAQTWLFNGFRKTVRDMAGRVFDRPVEIVSADARMAEWAANIDNAGNDLSTFARNVFEDGLAAGISYIMADAPPRAGTVTVAQAQALRPYLVHVRSTDVLGWKSALVNSAPVLTQLRLMECVYEDDPKDEFKQVETQQVRVLDRTESGVQVRIYRKVKAGNSEDWALWGEPGFTGLAEITVIPFYANRTGFFTGDPLLDDLADVNIAHWQSQSDQRQILHFARVPVLFAAGRSQEDGALTFSASTAVISSDPAATLQWVEHSGQAIGAGRQDLKDLEFQMETHGLQLLVAKPGAQSATGEALDAAKETSTLAMTADELKNTLEVALGWMAEYGGVSTAVEVNVNKEFGVNMMSAQDMTAMLSAVNTANLSRETFIAELARRGVIPPDTDVDEEIDRIGANAESLMPEPPQ